MVGIPNKTVPYLQTASKRVYSPHNQTSPYRWEAGKAPTCVHPLQGAGSKQGNLGRPPYIEMGEQRENVTQQLVSAKTNWLRRPFHNLWINRGGKPQTHSLEALAKENVYTHVHKHIHKLIHSPSGRRDTKPHTSKNAYRYLAGGLPRHSTGCVWRCLACGGCRSMCWRECSTLEHDPRPPSPHWITLGNGREAAECIGRGVSPTLWCCCAGVVCCGWEW